MVQVFLLAQNITAEAWNGNGNGKGQPPGVIHGSPVNPERKIP
jgi:hypothetical protein